MNKLKNMNESSFIKLFMGFLSACFVIAAFLMPDRANAFNGLWQIMSQPGKITTNYFHLGGYAATFLNMGLVGFICLGLFVALKGTANNVSSLAYLLTVGFASWGITVLNVWFTFAGVILYYIVKREKLSGACNAMMFSTGIAPLITDLLVRYPNAEVVGFNLGGLIVTLLVGLFIGFMLPAGLGHAPNVHKGLDIYSAAVPVCFLAFFLNATLYKTIGIDLPAVATDMTVAGQGIVNIFCILVFAICILVASMMGCKPGDYLKLLTAKEHVGNVPTALGKEVYLMNIGVFGLFILAYYNLIGASFNSVTFGLVFCMLCTAGSGSHPGNVWPIMLGYVVGSFGFSFLSQLAGGSYAMTINAQAIAIGLCFANGLSPITSKYGWFWGVVAAVMHFLLVTSVPNMHGGFCLYNGGFTAAVICVLLVPVLEKCVKTKAEKAAVK